MGSQTAQFWLSIAAREASSGFHSIYRSPRMRFLSDSRSITHRCLCCRGSTCCHAFTENRCSSQKKWGKLLRPCSVERGREQRRFSAHARLDQSGSRWKLQQRSEDPINPFPAVTKPNDLFHFLQNIQLSCSGNQVYIVPNKNLTC